MLGGSETYFGTGQDQNWSRGSQKWLSILSFNLIFQFSVLIFNFNFHFHLEIDLSESKVIQNPNRFKFLFLINILRFVEASVSVSYVYFLCSKLFQHLTVFMALAWLNTPDIFPFLSLKETFFSFQKHISIRWFPGSNPSIYGYNYKETINNL